MNSVGPGSYHTVPSLISPSFNALARSSQGQREEIIESHLKKFDEQNQVSQTSSFSRPGRPSSHPKHSSQKSHHHRMIFDASSMLTHRDSNETSFILGGAARIEKSSNHSNSDIPPQSQETNHQKDSVPIPTSVTREPGPTIHLYKEDVKSARKLFRGILQSTNEILTSK